MGDIFDGEQRKVIREFMVGDTVSHICNNSSYSLYWLSYRLDVRAIVVRVPRGPKDGSRL